VRAKQKTIYHDASIPIDLSLHKPYNYAFSPTGESYWQRVMRLATGSIVVTKTTQSEPMVRRLKTVIQSESKLNLKEIEEVKQRIAFELGVNDQFSVLKVIARNDVIFRDALYSIQGYRLYANSSMLETVMGVYLSQTHSPSSYRKIRESFLMDYGDSVPWNRNLWVFPKRSKLIDLSDDEWSELRLGKQEEYIRSALDNLHLIGTFAHYPDQKRGFDNLKQIFGVGEYTARSVMTYGARKYRYTPLDHIVRELISELYELHENINYGVFDQWAWKKFGSNPALPIHVLLTAYWPKYLKDIHLEMKLKY